MLIALTFAHFSSEQLLKELMIVPVKKSFHKRWSYRCKIDRFQRNLPKKTQRNRLSLLIVSWRSFPQKFPVKSAEFPNNLPLKILRFWPFQAKIPRIGPIFLQILTFPPRKSREIGGFFREFAPENPAKFCFFFRKISEAVLRYDMLQQNNCFPGSKMTLR